MHAHARTHACRPSPLPAPLTLPSCPPSPHNKNTVCNEFERFSRYLPDIKTKVFYGGVPVAEHKRILKSECPHIIVGTPGRILQLVREKELLTKGIKHFILDECDKMLEQLDMRRDVQEIFKATPHEKQVRV